MIWNLKIYRRVVLGLLYIHLELNFNAVIDIINYLNSLCLSHIARQREPGNLVLRHSVLIKILPFPTFHRILEVLRCVLCGGTQRRVLPRYFQGNSFPWSSNWILNISYTRVWEWGSDYLLHPLFLEYLVFSIFVQIVSIQSFESLASVLNSFKIKIQAYQIKLE